MRETSSTEAKSLLSGLQRRVRGLAMLHRTLYTSPEITTIDAAELVQAVVDDTRGQLPKNEIKVETSLTSIALYPDQAVPLSMFVAEILPNALSEETGKVQLDLTEFEKGTVKLSIRRSVQQGGDLKPDDQLSHGIGRNLVAAFASQLDGKLTADINDLEEFYELEFPIREVPHTW